MTIEFHWEVAEVNVTDVADISNVIVVIRVELVAVDTVTGNRESELYDCHYDAPDDGEFIDFASLTVDDLRAWVIAFHGSHDRGAWPHGEDAWVERQKSKLAARLSRRAAIRTPRFSGTVSEKPLQEGTL